MKKGGRWLLTINSRRPHASSIRLREEHAVALMRQQGEFVNRS
jgi:hypothetical protein